MSTPWLPPSAAFRRLPPPSAAFRRQSLAGEPLVPQLAVVAVGLASVAAISPARSEATFNRGEGRRVVAPAEPRASAASVWR
ncbi:hypothetical protein [Streptomyces sp. NPDC058678]|uniref:hypothetical protein n=1 Tax=Streptomyces sp. NPDC058678 TaxID=3346595 RepID=UPI00364CFEDA